VSRVSKLFEGTQEKGLYLCPSQTSLPLYTHTHTQTHTHIYIYILLTPWSRILLEKLTGLKLVKKFPAFYGTSRSITAFTSARHLSLFCASSIQSIPPCRTSYVCVCIYIYIYIYIYIWLWDFVRQKTE